MMAGTIGGRIAEARKRSGLSITALAKIVGVTRSAASQWESDDSAPSTENVAKVAVALDVSSEWLLTGRSNGSNGRNGHLDATRVSHLVDQLLELDHLSIRAIRESLVEGGGASQRLIEIDSEAAALRTTLRQHVERAD